MPRAAAVQTERGAGSLALERRYSERADVVVRVDYKSVDDLFSEFARNINEGGIFVETETPPERGTCVDLQFSLPGSDQLVCARGTVVRVSEGDSGDRQGMGIEFEDLDRDNRERIDDLVRNLRARV